MKSTGDLRLAPSLTTTSILVMQCMNNQHHIVFFLKFDSHLGICGLVLR